MEQKLNLSNNAPPVLWTVPYDQADDCQCGPVPLRRGGVRMWVPNVVTRWGTYGMTLAQPAHSPAYTQGGVSLGPPARCAAEAGMARAARHRLPVLERLGTGAAHGLRRPAAASSSPSSESLARRASVARRPALAATAPGTDLATDWPEPAVSAPGLAGMDSGDRASSTCRPTLRWRSTATRSRSPTRAGERRRGIDVAGCWLACGAYRRLGEIESLARHSDSTRAEAQVVAHCRWRPEPELESVPARPLKAKDIGATAISLVSRG